MAPVLQLPLWVSLPRFCALCVKKKPHLPDSPQQSLIHFSDGNSVPSTSYADFSQQPDLLSRHYGDQNTPASRLNL
ncbi:UNVERIFIED_CONTAM: hypothetical protein FKN15_027720 [Acipenser sinensis]